MKLPLRTAFLGLPVTLILGLFTFSGAHAATLEGRWRLVEQQAGAGRSNLASPEAPLRLEFYLSGPSLAGRIWTAEQPPRSFPWPCFATEQGPLPIRVEQLVISPASDAARAVYRVGAPGGGKEGLRVEEEYRLSEGGGALLGTVKITSLEGESPRGSYQLRRRFAREPGKPGER
jgi:hypothetical protein